MPSHMLNRKYILPTPISNLWTLILVYVYFFLTYLLFSLYTFNRWNWSPVPAARKCNLTGQSRVSPSHFMIIIQVGKMLPLIVSPHVKTSLTKCVISIKNKQIEKFERNWKFKTQKFGSDKPSITISRF